MQYIKPLYSLNETCNATSWTKKERRQETRYQEGRGDEETNRRFGLPEYHLQTLLNPCHFYILSGSVNKLALREWISSTLPNSAIQQERARKLSQELTFPVARSGEDRKLTRS
jgi:hypothetical protein